MPEPDPTLKSDRWYWALESHGRFTIRSTDRLLHQDKEDIIQGGLDVHMVLQVTGKGEDVPMVSHAQKTHD